MIIFEKIGYKNILSTGNVWTEIEFTKNKNTLVVGTNGAGKSTMLDALCFVLFNKPYRNINKPTLVNSINQKELLVEVVFRVGLTQYKVIRGIKPNVFDIYKNDVRQNQDASSPDFQDRFEKQILKMNFKAFCQIVIMGAARNEPFMQLSAAHRREVVEDILDIQIFTKMNLLHKKQLEVAESSMRNVDAEVRIVESKIELSKQHAQEIASNIEDSIKEKRTHAFAMANTVLELQERKSDLDKKVAELTQRSSELQKSVQKRDKYTQLKGQIESKLKTLNNHVSFFTDNESCPTCRQNIEPGFKAEMIDTYTGQVKEVDDGYQKLMAQITELNGVIVELNAINKTVSTFFTEKNVIDSQIAAKNQDIRRIEAEIKKLEDSLLVKKDDVNITGLEDELSGLELSRKMLVSRIETLKMATMILKDSGIKSRVIKQYIPVINKIINKYLSDMDFFVGFELDETFKETIKSRFRDEFSYANFSEGEKFRINLAIMFTWRTIAKMRNSASTNLLIMDEVFDSSLDPNGTEEFMKILFNLTSDTNTFIISHKGDQLFDKFDKVIRFDKHHNFSRMIADGQ